jgi:hypothetical protein
MTNPEAIVMLIWAIEPGHVCLPLIRRRRLGIGFYLNNTYYRVLAGIRSNEIRESLPRLREW